MPLQLGQLAKEASLAIRLLLVGLPVAKEPQMGQAASCVAEPDLEPEEPKVEPLSPALVP